jgi:hypothetical protein
VHRQAPAQYKALADIERGFKVLKSEIEIGPASRSEYFAP